MLIDNQNPFPNDIFILYMLPTFLSGICGKNISGFALMIIFFLFLFSFRF